MKAIQISQYGGPEVLKIAEVTLKKPGPNEALVRIKRAGINFVDIYQRRGFYPVALPFTPGLEASGIVEEVGSAVKNVKVDDRVAYVHEPGSYAEHCLVHANRLITLPEELSFEEGAAFPLQGMTAHYLLFEYRQIKEGETILIHAAAGGMGLLLVQWAKHLGAKVIGTTSTEEKAQMAFKAGCDEVILYSKQDFASEAKRLTNGRGVDLIIDGVGKTTFPGNLEAICSRGHIVIFGAASGPADPISPNVLMGKSITLSGGTLFNYLETDEELKMRSSAVMEGISQGWLKLKIDEIFPLEKAKEAHQKLESRNSSGKILLAC